MINPSASLRIKVALVRGSYLNNFEGQNYNFDPKKIELVGISSLHPLHGTFSFPVMKLPSIADYVATNRAVKIIANRTFGDSQVLFGLGKLSPEFDIFHTADPHYYYSYQLAKLRSQNKIKKLLVTSWETIPFNNETVRAKKRIKHFVLKHVDHFLCYTDKAKECLIQEGVDGVKISVIKLGVDLQLFMPSKSKSKKFTILFVGRLVEEKGVLDLYEAFKNVKSQISNVKSLMLHIVGEGPLKHKLSELIEKDGMKKCISMEKVSYENMPKVFQKADMFVLPSKKTATWEEQYGMVLVEAMASGLPIVTYDTGAIREIVDNAGIYIHDGDVGGLAFAIRNLIADKPFAQKLGTMGRERAEKEFDCRNTAKKIEKLYRRLLKT